MLLSNGFAPDPRVAVEAQALRDAGHQITIFAWDRTGKLPLVEDFNGISVVRCPINTTYSKGPLQIVKFRQFWKACRAFLESNSPQAIHCHDLDTLSPGVKYGRKNRIPVIYDAHESYPDMVAHLFPSFIVGLIRRLESGLIKRTEAVITVGAVLGQHFRELNARKVVIVGNYKKMAPSAPVKPEPAPPLKLTYVGGLNRDRLLGPMIEAIAGDKRYHFSIIGDGPERTRLQDLAQQNTQNPSNIRFAGFLPQDEARQIIEQSHLVYYAIDAAYPNNRFSAPNSLFLALAAGRPLIVTPIGEVARIVTEENCGTVLDDLQPETIIKALAAYLDGTLWEDQASNSYHAAQLKYNWDRAKSNLIELYNGFTGNVAR